MRAWLLLAITLLGCGDNLGRIGPPLGAAAELQIVAHQDDDLLFMQPDLYDAVARGEGVTNVYVTAGDGSHGIDFSERRYEGLLEAYGVIAGSSDWQCGTIEIAGHAAEHCRLDAAKLSLVFLGYPDGGKQGEVRHSLLHLWEGKVRSAHTIARSATTYDRDGLIATVAEVIDTAAPRLVRTLEIAATHGRDHADHMVVGALAVLAVAASHQRPELVAFRGYNTEDEPGNADPALYARSEIPLLHYHACADGCAPCGSACKTLERAHAVWLGRRYAVGMRRRFEGALQLDGRCLTAAPGRAAAALGDCATAPIWRLDQGRLIAQDGRCLAVLPTGDVIAAPSCDPGPASTFIVDDEGRVWSGVPPEPEDDMAHAHLRCLARDGEAPRAVLCGDRRAPSWKIMRPTASTPRSALGIAGTGRALRLGDLGLCEIADGDLRCAELRADGTLAPTTAIAPLPVASFALGDVDGDQRDDACGVDAAGVLCATAETGFRAVRWTTQLANASDLAIVGGKVCGVTAGQLVCAARDALAPDVVAARQAIAADLDGDGQPDWCTAGPACGLGADRAVTSAPIAWGYAMRGGIDTPAPDPDRSVFGDIDGDGRADLCTARNGALVCSRSLAHGYGPCMPITTLPAGMVPSGVWATAGRLCAGDATQIVCTH